MWTLVSKPAHFSLVFLHHVQQISLRLRRCHRDCTCGSNLVTKSVGECGAIWRGRQFRCKKSADVKLEAKRHAPPIKTALLLAHIMERERERERERETHTRTINNLSRAFELQLCCRDLSGMIVCDTVCHTTIVRNLWAVLHKSARRLRSYMRTYKMCEIIINAYTATAAARRDILSPRQLHGNSWFIHSLKHLYSALLASHGGLENKFALVMSQRARIHCKQWKYVVDRMW